MKNKLICFTLLIFIFISITSCKNIQNTTSSNNNAPKYFIFILNDMLVKINIETAVSTTLCQDPLCDHSDSGKYKCPFSCYSSDYSVTESGNIIYFVHTKSEIDTKNPKANFYKQIKRYNLLTGELKDCYEIKNTITSNIAYKEDYYFTEMYNEKNKKGEDIIFTNFYRITSDGMTIKINNDKIEGYYFLQKIKNDRLYYFDSYNPSKKYNTTLELSDLQNTVNNESEQKYDFEYSKDSNTNCEIIKSIKDSNGNRIIITDKACLSFIINDYIYYTKHLDEKKLIIEDNLNNKKYYKGIESKFYRAKYDGSENGEFCDFGEHLEPFYINNYNYKSFIDDYCLISFKRYEKEKNGNVYYNFEYAVLNLKTGEYKMVT